MLQERWSNLNGIKIRYLESGEKNNRHLLFIHGLGSSADRWLNIPDALSANFHSVVIDLPGFGKSDKPATMDYTIENFKNIVSNFVDDIAINDGKTSIVGHSLGGYIAAEVAMENKDKVQRLVLIDSSGMLRKPTPLLDEYLEAAMNPEHDNVRKAFEKMVADPARIPSSLVTSFIKRMNLPNAKYAFKSTLQHSANTQLNLENLSLLSKVPTLIIWGTEDKVIPLEHSKLFREFVKNSKVKIIPDSGHAPFAEKPTQVLEILNNFLD